MFPLNKSAESEEQGKQQIISCGEHSHLIINKKTKQKQLQ